jgi:photosystem II stability/assembly factor-like uncharacterized protein
MLIAAMLLATTLDVDLHWRLIGPFRGGRVLAVSGVPGQPQHFYFGSVNGGVWETNDTGRTWQPIFDSQPIGSIGALAIAPSDPQTIYVGSGEADMRSDIAQGDGMYKSTDAGRTWSHIGLTDSQQTGRIIIHPTNPNLVYVAALGHPYAANAERGVFRSRDGGANWQKILGPNDDTGAIDLAFEPGHPEIIYAALWQTRRTPWSVYPPSSGPGSGLYKSTDGGETWKKLEGGLPHKAGRIGIAVAPSQPSRVYAIVDSEEAGGMYRSDDAGATWTRTSSDTRVWSRGWYFGDITVEPKNADVVYSCNVNVFRSQDAGKTFVPIKGAPGGDDYHHLWIDPEVPDRRILGVDQGTVISINGGRTWSSWFNQPTGQFYHVVTDNRFPYVVYGAQQDSGAASVPSRTNTYDGITMTEFREITAGGESDNIAPDPKDPDIIFGGRVEKLDLRTYQTLSVDPTINVLENGRRTWTLPLTFSARDPRVLYFSNQRLYRTDDGGNHWTAISPDLTRENPGTPKNLDPITASIRAPSGSRLGVIYAIAPSRVADGDLWIGTDDGMIWRTRDEGAHWDNITPADLTPWSKVGIIDASHFDAETAYAAIDRHRLDDFRPYVYRTHDGGKSWKLIASGIPDGSFVNAVREDPMRRGMLYAGTEKGVYVSLDDGDRWQSLQKNLPVTSVRDIDVHGNDVVIATHGRAFWIMDDVTPLRQIDSLTAPALFRPAVAVRVRPAGFTGSPMPKDEPMASNPPSGAYIDYSLASAATQPVVLEIFDANNTLVRRYSSADSAPKPDPAKLRTAPEWFAIPSTLSAAAGSHRFVWPIRYPAANAKTPYSDGVWAPPGNYRVTLTIDGKPFTQPLTIAPDPRVNLPASAYAEQFALAREIDELHGAISAALDEAEKLIADPKTSEADRKRALEISEVNSPEMWWLAPRTTTSLRFLDTQLQKLEQAVDSADAAPTQDAREGFAKVKPLADAALAAWRSVKKSG